MCAESVNVLVTSVIGDECLRWIADVSPRIKLVNVAGLLRAENEGDLSARERLDAVLREADVMFGLRFPNDVLTRSPRLKWIQTMSAGIDRFLDAEMVASSVTLTNVSGIHATPIGEFVLGLMLMFAKNAPLHFQMKQEKQWKRLPPSILRSRTVGIVGLGSIGREVARLAKAFGMRVVATRRSAKGEGRAKNVDLLLPADRLGRLLEESDFVVLAVPATAETRGLIGEGELRAMKSSAYLINISRGETVDEEALTHALEEHWIGGAGLDVFASEPLLPDSRLWELANVIFSPHVAGGMEEYAERATERFVENLRRYLDGKKLRNVVDKKRGY